jgi:predicted phage tail protein
MKHLLKKLNLAGAGGGGKPTVKPAELNPPQLGVHQMAGSFAHAEILDLISDGPIEGLVNKDGVSCNNDIFQGIYLNDTAIKTTDGKYNFGNVLAQANWGEENQAVLSNFKNVYFDTTYNATLRGPYRQAGQVDRINENTNMISDGYTILRYWNGGYGGAANTDALTYNPQEGSNDSSRLVADKSFSDWNQLDNGDEKADPITHIIHNPNVESCFVSLAIEYLQDTLTKDIKGVNNGNGGTTKLEAGIKYPAVLYITVETGKINANGEYITSDVYHFRFVALIQSETNIDLGNSDTADFKQYYKWIQSDSGKIFDAFPLPAVSMSGKEQTYEKRYIKITRQSTETYSSLIMKRIKLAKVTELIPVRLTYPFSAIIGTKIDSRSFASIPSRVFDAKLKLIRIPTNYNPINSNTGKDKRYLKIASETKQNVYDGFWDGDFKWAWSDNPAWVLYDMISSKRYGLGQYLDENKIDKWDLYKIGRFCDAVDDNGNFVGVPDLRGGLEPRFSCNIIIQEKTKLYDSINTIAALFRGIVYYHNSEINFVDDRPKTPSALFTNSNVKDGFFSYSNYKRDEQYNAMEVAYIDRFENFESRIEYVEDEEDIRRRGVFKKTLNAIGVTSRAMARRIGQHFIFQTLKENQSVTFMAGLESLLCRPGDLIIVEDELKTLKSNFGRVLNADRITRKIRLSEKHNSTDFYNKLTVYAPTGSPTLQQLNTEDSQEIINYRNNNLVSSISQITTFTNISTIENKDFGCEVTVSSSDINSNLIQYIAPGSVYRFERKNSEDRVYKVLSIKEESPNEYQVIATKYITGKYNFIEKNQSIKYKEDNYVGGGGGININIETLPSPENLIISTSKINGSYRLNGTWDGVVNAAGYNVRCQFPNGVIEEQRLTTSQRQTYFSISAIGEYIFSVAALGNPSQPVNNTAYYDSDYNEQSLFFINYDDELLIKNNRCYMLDIIIS